MWWRKLLAIDYYWLLLLAIAYYCLLLLDIACYCLLFLDGSDYSIWKTRKRWLSHKLKTSEVRYKIGVGILSGDICSINGPFSCGDYPAINIFSLVIKRGLDEDERSEGDCGYTGDMIIKSSGFPYIDEKCAKMKRRVTQRHTSGNMWLKVFNCLNKKPSTMCQSLQYTFEW